MNLPAISLVSPVSSSMPPTPTLGPAPALSKLSVRGLSAGFGASQNVLHAIDLDLPQHAVTSIIGPSGCGKSTFLRCLNRMHELTAGARVEGEVMLDGQDVYQHNIDAVALRRRVGMVFQKPNPFPSMSIRQNVLAGLRLTGRLPKNSEEVMEQALGQAALWDEVKDRLDAKGGSLSGGQQQRLCIARALAVAPDVLLMDEPCSALDPIATAHIEALIAVLRERYTIVIVTHSMQQAARVSDRTAFFLMGDIVEVGDTEQVFEQPIDTRTADYINGKFG